MQHIFSCALALLPTSWEMHFGNTELFFPVVSPSSYAFSWHLKISGPAEIFLLTATWVWIGLSIFISLCYFLSKEIHSLQILFKSGI